jgi:hypothetical protein
VSLNQFLVVAATEKMSAMMAEQYLAKEGKLASRAGFAPCLHGTCWPLCQTA